MKINILLLSISDVHAIFILYLLFICFPPKKFKDIENK